MGSFLIGTGVTLVTFYIALIYGSIAIGLIGFAELVLMLLACLYLLIYCRHITADIRIPLTVVEKAKDTKEEKEVFSMKKHKEVIKKNKVDLKV